MSNIETSVANWYTTTLTGAITDTDLTIPVDSIGTLTSPSYVIIDPDNASKREVILADGTWGASSFVASDLSSRGLAGSASGAQAHASGTVVAVAPLAQHVQDLHDRVEAHDHGGGTAGTAVATADLTGHDKATHDGLGLDHGSLSGKSDDDHPLYGQCFVLATPAAPQSIPTATPTILDLEIAVGAGATDDGSGGIVVDYPGLYVIAMHAAGSSSTAASSTGSDLIVKVNGVTEIPDGGDKTYTSTTWQMFNGNSLRFGDTNIDLGTKYLTLAAGDTVTVEVTLGSGTDHETGNTYVYLERIG